jgi:hypothetical protein
MDKQKMYQTSTQHVLMHRIKKKNVHKHNTFDASCMDSRKESMSRTTGFN